LGSGRPSDSPGCLEVRISEAAIQDFERMTAPKNL